MQDLIDAILRAPPGLSGLPLAIAVGLAQWAILIGPAVLAWLWIAGSREDRAAAIAAAAAGVVGLLIAAVASPLIGEARPFVHGGATNYLHHAPDGGFPSDHATLAFALALGLLLRRPPLAPRVWAPLAALAVAVGWARVFLGAHHAVDVAGGAAVGFAAARSTATRTGTRVLSLLDRLDEAFRSGMLALVGRPRGVR